MALLEKVKANLILNHSEDDVLIEGYIAAAISYAEGYQQVGTDFYVENPMSPTTEQGIIMLATHFYESRDGSTAGFFNDTVNASDQVWKTVHMLLRMGKEWQV
jgi:uncharacterized phage protein (predicted DNA packaging)